MSPLILMLNAGGAAARARRRTLQPDDNTSEDFHPRPVAHEPRPCLTPAGTRITLVNRETTDDE